MYSRTGSEQVLITRSPISLGRYSRTGSGTDQQSPWVCAIEQVVQRVCTVEQVVQRVCTVEQVVELITDLPGYVP